MKTLLLALSLSTLLLSFNCIEDPQGTYTIESKTYKGKVSTQEFVNKNFSVLCEYSDESSSDYKKWKYDLLQITFHSKAEALKGGTFKVNSTSTLNIESGKVSLSGHDGLANLFGDSNSSITVSNKTIKILNIKVTKYPATHQGKTNLIPSTMPIFILSNLQFTLP